MNVDHSRPASASAGRGERITRPALQQQRNRMEETMRTRKKITRTTAQAPAAATSTKTVIEYSPLSRTYFFIPNPKQRGKVFTSSRKSEIEAIARKHGVTEIEHITRNAAKDLQKWMGFSKESAREIVREFFPDCRSAQAENLRKLRADQQDTENHAVISRIKTERRQDLAEVRKAAARKAWETIRARKAAAAGGAQ